MITELKLTQAALAERLGVSPATVSRWIQGKHEPTAEGYIALGNLAPKADAPYFWERAGMDVGNLAETGFGKVVSSLRVNLDELTVVSNRAVPGHPGGGAAVAIPLLQVSAFGDNVPPGESMSLSEMGVEEMIFAPAAWCANPEHMISMRLAGSSMEPSIAAGSILFVDTAVTVRDALDGKIVVVSHRDLGFKAARLQRLAGVDLLIPANQRHLPLDVSNASKWKVFGEVLWWISRDAGAA